MATYAFETIAATQALSILATDTLTFASGPSNQVTVLYNPASPGSGGGTITIMAGGRVVEFGAALSALGLAGGIQASDGSRIYIVNDSANAATAPATAANDAIYGGAGNDSLDGGGGDDLLQGNAGQDFLVGGPGRDVIYGGQDGDYIVTTVRVEPGVEFPRDDGNFAQGNKGDDKIEGGLGDDTLLGGQGNDMISGLDGLDFLNGNLGDDTIYGKGSLYGEDGNDQLIGSGRSDLLYGGAGNDTITSRGGSVDGGTGADKIEVGQGGGGDNNTVLGGEGADTISAQYVSNVTPADQALFGDDGDDRLIGSVWGDLLSGGAGNDTLVNGGGWIDDLDVMSGGAGQDLFIIFNRVSDATTGLQLDAPRIVDWQSADRIDFPADGLGAGTALTYRETTASSLGALQSVMGGFREQGVYYVAAQIGNDVAVFGLSFQFNRAAVLLVGRTLDDVSFENFV